jgi:hypothetical protein
VASAKCGLACRLKLEFILKNGRRILRPQPVHPMLGLAHREKMNSSRGDSAKPPGKRVASLRQVTRSATEPDATGFGLGQAPATPLSFFTVQERFLFAPGAAKAVLRLQGPLRPYEFGESPTASPAERLRRRDRDYVSYHTLQRRNMALHGSHWQRSSTNRRSRTGVSAVLRRRSFASAT